MGKEQSQKAFAGALSITTAVVEIDALGLKGCKVLAEVILVSRGFSYSEVVVFWPELSA